MKSAVTKRKGRGFSSATHPDIYRNDAFDGINRFDRLPESGTHPETCAAQKSIEGWNVFIRGIHSETTEDDLHDFCAEFGPVKNLRMVLDHRTGYVKGYAVVEYESFREAQEAIEGLGGAKLMDSVLQASWAFVVLPPIGDADALHELRSTRRSIRRR